MIIEKVTMKSQAHDYIRDAIISGEMDANKIYSVPELSGMLQISRTPVREAMLQLEVEGFVEILPNRGMRIKGFDRRTLTDIYQIRLVVEGFCCEYLARHIAEPEAQKLLIFLSMLMEENEKSITNFTNNDLLFHQKIVSFTGNSRFEEQMSNMRLYTSLFAQKLMRWNESGAEHRKIYEAIASGDPEAARQASNTHVINTYHEIINSGKVNLGNHPEDKNEGINLI